MLRLNFDRPKDLPLNILFLGAHSDDIEIGCAGTEYKLIQSGFEATHVYITSGEAGSKTISKLELSKIRENEAIKSARDGL